MTPEDKAYYSDGNYPLFELMSQEHGLTLTEGQLFDVINCVRAMDEAVKPEKRPFYIIANEKFGYDVSHDIEFYTYEEAAEEYAKQ